MNNLDVGQDYVAMKKIAEDIHQKAEEFLKLKEELYQELNTKLGDKTLTVWSGNRSEACLAELKNKEYMFNNIYSNIEKLAGSLEEQAVAWEQFETAA